MEQFTLTRLSINVAWKIEIKGFNLVIQIIERTEIMLCR